VTSANDVVVHCEGLTKKYEEIVALDNLDLDIYRGHVFGYIGHNGAGKTTTIRILSGLLQASSGKATICGVDVARQRDKIRRLIGYMPDSFGVYDQMRVWEYLDFFGAAFKIPRKHRKKRLDYVLDISDAEYMRDRFVDTLSKGMKQRVGIARTLMHDPEVLLLDEPASGLDPSARIQMRHLLRRLADSGKTLLVSSHILPELAAVCDSIGIIHSGKLRAAGPIQDVLAQLQRDRIMEVKALAQAPKAAAVLEANENAAHVDTAEIDSGIVRFRFRGDDEAVAKLLADIQAAQAQVVTFREVPLSLEDAYMAISGLEEDEEEERQVQQETQNQPATQETSAS
jgi:ABC-2 type transport system ATP-binding protein